MNGRPAFIRQANENAAKWLAYASPYLFWGVVCVMCAGIWVLGA